MEKQLDQSTHFAISSNISEIYKCTPEILETEHIPRYQKFIADFHNLYNINPKFIVRAPGRVNLIGEHIDYAGYGVLPMALEQDAIIAFTPTEDSELEVNHVLSALYPSHKLPVDPSQNLKDEKSYINYFIAGYKAGLSNANLEKYSGIKVLISGNLLQEAGLSSSSSFIVSVGLMALVANGLAEKTDKKEFIENAVKCERLVGTAGGGMDQTISVLAETGKAFYIQFNPLNLTPVELPSGYCFVVANSLTPSPKVLTLGTRYNKRVVECRFALKILMKELKTEKASEIKNLKQLQDSLKLSFDEMIELVQKYLKEEPYSIKQIEDSIGETASKAISDIQNNSVVLESNTEYFLYQRAKHVFSEAARVIAFKEVCESDIPPEQKGIKLGDLMNHSHYSCRDLYDCSSEQLDELTTLCRGLGASGSRVTGAGWGGCCVSLIKENKAMVFLHELNLQYYGKKDDESHVAEDLRTDVFASCPSSGAGILNVDQEKWF